MSDFPTPPSTQPSDGKTQYSQKSPHGRLRSWRQCDLLRQTTTQVENLTGLPANGAATEANKQLARLRQALRAEKARGLSGHRSYDLARHARLALAYRSALKLLKNGNVYGRTS